MNGQNGMVRRSPGRPSKLTADTEARILSMVRSGSSNRTACMAAGICERTFYMWKTKGESPDEPPEYSHFLQELTRAEQEGHAARLALIQKAARTDWRAAAWMQERLDPERWSLKHQVEHSGQVGAMTFGAVLRKMEERNRARTTEDVAPGVTLPAPKEAV